MKIATIAPLSSHCPTSSNYRITRQQPATEEHSLIHVSNPSAACREASPSYRLTPITYMLQRDGTQESGIFMKQCYVRAVVNNRGCQG